MGDYCSCIQEWAMYNDFGDVKCQNCMGLVSEERRNEFIKYNEPDQNKVEREEGA